MAKTVTITTKGFEEIERALTKLPDKVARKVIIKGVRAGARVALKDIRRAAPTRGTRKALKSKVRRARNAPIVTAVIGPSTSPQFNAPTITRPALVSIQEFGTIRRVTAAGAFRGEIKGTGFMERAFRNSKGRAFEAMKRKIEDEIHKEAAKL